MTIVVNKIRRGSLTTWSITSYQNFLLPKRRNVHNTSSIPTDIWINIVKRQCPFAHIHFRVLTQAIYIFPFEWKILSLLHLSVSSREDGRQLGRTFSRRDFKPKFRQHCSPVPAWCSGPEAVALNGLVGPDRFQSSMTCRLIHSSPFSFLRLRNTSTFFAWACLGGHLQCLLKNTHQLDFCNR